MKETSGFKFTVAKELEERFGSAVVVRQVGNFSLKVGKEDRYYKMAVTYVMVEVSGALKIAHPPPLELKRLRAGRERFVEDPSVRFRLKTVHRVLTDARQLAQLAKAPVRHAEARNRGSVSKSAVASQEAGIQ